MHREKWDAGRSCENEAGERQGSDHTDPLWQAKVCELILRIRQGVSFFSILPSPSARSILCVLGGSHLWIMLLGPPCPSASEWT